MRESKIEKAFVQRVKSMGGMCEKFTSPGRRSVPDRLVTLPKNRIVFAEIKREGEAPTPAQLRDHARRRALGCEVVVIDSMEAVNAFV